MANKLLADNGAISGISGLSYTSDSSGALQIYTGAGVLACTIDANQNVILPNNINVPNTFGFKNRIINGAMMIDQRNAGAAVTITADGQYALDRWSAQVTPASKFTVQQNAGSVTPPVGFKNYLGVTSSSAYSVGATDFETVVQIIEGLNFYDMAWGTANATPVTLSFWVRSSLTGTFGGSVANMVQDRNYPFSYTINSANTWEQKSITIAGDTSGTWPTTNAGCLRLRFGLGVGSTYSGTAGSWSSSLYLSATGATSVVGTNGATFYITGVQLEKGSTATSFDYRPYGTELALCQRYFEMLGTGQFVGRAISTSVIEGNLSFTVTKRATPTITYVNGTSSLAEVGVAVRSFTALSSSGVGTKGIFLQLTGSSSLTSPNMVMFYSNESIVSASSEL